MEVDSNPGVDDRSRDTSLHSMDDLEAAQALEGLRSDYGHSPRASAGPSSNSPPSALRETEPLISLLTTSHPLISSAIDGSVSAYTTSKSYSPRFKSGAEFIERNIGSPVASTVGTVGRKTGVESGLRWALQRREASRAKARVGDSSAPAEMDVEKGAAAMDDSRMRSSSELSCPESLPPYDDHKSPSYDTAGGDMSSSDRQTWQSRLVISTSGLGVAMSQESLCRLQYCLTWLRWANGRLGKAVVALQGALREWEHARAQNGADSSVLSQRIQAVKADVLATLKQVVDVVSKYAGGALPDNARVLVRRHLTSLPHRFQVASTSHPPPESAASSSEATVGAHRILVLAQEGLDMMAQVSGVVNDTLVSAEHWCERLGTKRREGADNEAEPKDGEVEQKASRDSFPVDVKEPILEPDVHMTGVEETA
ncbi:Clock controled protein [Aspergillus sp. HF37]|nr:Clock controled protein [Aspergillus sp. HF37]